MSIQWYPGHMTKARQAMAEVMPSHDVIIEVLDARMPGSSENPVVTELRKQKPCIKVLSKSDLADPEVTASWLRYLGRDRPGARVAAVATRMDRQTEARTRIAELCKKLALHP